MGNLQLMAGISSRPATATVSQHQTRPGTACVTRPATARAAAARPGTAKLTAGRPSTAKATPKNRPGTARPETARTQATRPGTARPATALQSG